MVIRQRQHSFAAGRVDEAPKLDLQVVYTGVENTRRALAAAGQLSRGLDARVKLLVPHVVPYPLSLEHPDVPPGFHQHALGELASSIEAESSVEILVCRDRDATLREALLPRSMVLIGGSRRLWPTAERRLARLLRKDGHKVILVEQ